MTLDVTLYFMLGCFVISFLNTGFRRDVSFVCTFSLLVGVLVSRIVGNMGAQYYVFAFAVDIIFMMVLITIVSKPIIHIYFFIWIPYLIALFMHAGIIVMDYLLGLGIVYPQYESTILKLNIVQILILLAGCDGIRTLYLYLRGRYHDFLLSLRAHTRLQSHKEIL